MDRVRRGIASVVPVLVIAACGGNTAIELDAQPACEPACGAHATCEGATCVCEDGYIGDGLACREVWTMVASLAFDIAPSSYEPAVVVHRESIFVGIETNTAGVGAWRAIDVSAVPRLGPALTLPPVEQNDFCFCGATQTLVSDGQDAIYMLGNHAQRYDVSANRWVEIPGYTVPADLRRAEAASVFDPAGPWILTFGGRGPTDEVLRFAPGDGTFVVDASTLPASISDAAAWLPPAGDAIFVAGGRGQLDAPQNHILSRPTGAGAWVVHPEVDGDITAPIGMGDFRQRIWVASANGRAYFYDPATSTWDPTIDLPADTRAVVTAGGATWALSRTAGGVLDLYRLSNID